MDQASANLEIIKRAKVLNNEALKLAPAILAHKSPGNYAQEICRISFAIAEMEHRLSIQLIEHGTTHPRISPPSTPPPKNFRTDGL